MCKIITYWKFNINKELDFFNQEMNNKLKLSDTELNQRITEALNESDNINKKEDNEFKDNSFDLLSRVLQSQSSIENSI